MSDQYGGITQADVAEAMQAPVWQHLRERGLLPVESRGDGPCMDCGTLDTPVWYTDNVTWNLVVGGPETRDDPGGPLCPLCFIRRAEAVTAPVGWKLTPEWPIRYRDERRP